jgi:hypothetical protein
VPVLVPAPVNLVNYETVAVDRFQGDGCDPFSQELAATLGSATNPLTGKPGFVVLSRQDVDRALDGSRDSRNGDVDKRTMEVLDRWRKAPVVLKGTMQQHSVEQRRVEESSQDARGNVIVRCKQVYTANVQVELEATEVAGNRAIDSVTLHGGSCAEVALDPHRPAVAPDPRTLLANARNDVLQQYLARVLPRRAWVSVDLYKDGKFPDLELGNGYAQVGNWPSAIAAYERALQAMTGDLEKGRYMGLFNLGVAYEFSDRFDDAQHSFEEAYALGKEQRILAELRRNEARKDEVQRLREQGAAATPSR